MGGGGGIRISLEGTSRDNGFRDDLSLHKLHVKRRGKNGSGTNASRGEPPVPKKRVIELFYGEKHEGELQGGGNLSICRVARW